MISLICGILKKTQMNSLQNRNRLTDIENKLTLTRGRRRWEGINWEFEICAY